LKFNRSRERNADGEMPEKGQSLKRSGEEKADRKKQDHHNKEYRYLRTKLFVQILIMLFIGIWAIFLIYDLFLQGRFANWVVFCLQNIFRMDYDTAIEAYRRLFRDHFGNYFIGGMAVIFLIMISFYIRWFTKYFKEINKGIDALLREDSAEVSLSPELQPIEKKINTIRHILTKRKLDARTEEKRKNDLVVYLAHDLKTPLTSVIGYLTLLHDEKQISAETREKYLAISLEKAERLEELINEFFEITRYSLLDITLQYTKVNLTRLLEQLTFEFLPMLSQKNLRCDLHAKQDYQLRCDVDQMQRVFDNLLRNAVFYSYENTTIDIFVIPEENSVTIRFQNQGDTIPAEKLERIFEQFYRLDRARGSNQGGAGLGLAIAKEIVERHGGTITAKSEKEKTGFEVVLPLLQKAELS